MSKEGIFQRLCEIFAGFVVGAVLLFVAVTMGGCSRKVVYVPTESRVVNADTIRQVATRTDSVWLRDSVYVERVSGLTGDTIRMEVYRDRYRDRLRVDTIYRARIDSVAVREPYPVEVVKEVNRIKSWQWALMAVGIVALIPAGVWIVAKIKKLKS